MTFLSLRIPYDPSTFKTKKISQVGSTQLKIVISHWFSYPANQGLIWLCGWVMHGWQGGLLLTRCRHRVALTQSWPPTLFIEIKEKEGNSRILAIRNNFISCISQFFRSSFLKVSLKVLDSCVWVSMSHSHRFLIQSERLMSPHITRPFVYNFQSRLHSRVLFLAGESTLYLKSVAEEHTLRYFAGLIPKRNHALLIVLAQERPPSPQRNEKKAN